MIGKIKHEKCYNSSENRLNDREYYNLRISLLSFVCINGVILIHSNNINSYGLFFENHLINGLIGVIEILMVKLAAAANSYFFMISGYHFYHAISWEKIPDKLFRRIKALVIPYIIAVGASILYYYLISAIPNLMERLGMPQIVWTPSLIIDQFLHPTFNYPLWFTNYLIIFSYLAPFLYQIYFRKKMAFVIGIILIITNVCSFIDNSYYAWFSVFYIGGYIGFNSKDITDGLSFCKSKKHQGITVVLLGCFTFLLVFEHYFGSMKFISNTYMYMSPFILWELSGMVLKDGKKTLKSRWWMNISFFVYSYHVLILPVITKIMKMALPNHPIIALLNFIVAPVMTYMILVLIAKIIKTKPGMWNFITGGRG